MKSCIYTGQVRHRRFAPRDHEFRYRLFMMYVDLAELPLLFDKHWFWSSKNFALAWFRREDHYGKPGVRLNESIRQLVQKETGNRPRGPIRLLTHFRYFGYCFNPVSFYYCFDEADTQVETIVAEINNTPWGEQHCYVLPDRRNTGNRRHKRFKFGKDFHVSPFMAMDIDYDWRFTQPGEHLNIHMENYRTSADTPKKIFDATMVMHKRPLTALNLAKTLTVFPFMTGKVIAGIYYQALKLWLKKIPFYPHPRHSLGELKTQPTVEES